MKRSHKLPPPFEMSRPVLHEWLKLQDELPGGTARGNVRHDWEVFRLGVMAEHQAEWKRNRHRADVETLKRYRVQFGLDPLPKPQAAHKSGRQFFDTLRAGFCTR